MIYEEALEYSKQVLKQCETYIDKVIFFKGHYINAKNYVKLVVDALEKQTSKKPIKDDTINDYCPECGACVGYTDAMAWEHPHYCWYCGQKIDWSGEE